MNNINELRDALLTIQIECSSHTICSACPLCVGDNKCGVTGVKIDYDNYKVKPQYWQIPAVKLMEDPTKN